MRHYFSNSFIASDGSIEWKRLKSLSRCDWSEYPNFSVISSGEYVPERSSCHTSWYLISDEKNFGDMPIFSLNDLSSCRTDTAVSRDNSAVFIVPFEEIMLYIPFKTLGFNRPRSRRL